METINILTPHHIQLEASHILSPTLCALAPQRNNWRVGYGEQLERIKVSIEGDLLVIVLDGCPLPALHISCITLTLDEFSDKILRPLFEWHFSQVREKNDMVTDGVRYH